MLGVIEGVEVNVNVADGKLVLVAIFVSVMIGRGVLVLNIIGEGSTGSADGEAPRGALPSQAGSNTIRKRRRI
jgi:hypothetical protein